jgi:hypothetical protein
MDEMCDHKCILYLHYRVWHLSMGLLLFGNFSISISIWIQEAEQAPASRGRYVLPNLCLVSLRFCILDASLGIQLECLFAMEISKLLSLVLSCRWHSYDVSHKPLQFPIFRVMDFATLAMQFSSAFLRQHTAPTTHRQTRPTLFD